MYYGNSLLEERQFRRAEESFENAVQAKKTIVKIKHSAFQNKLGEMAVDLFPEPEIRFKWAKCLEATQQVSKASTVLQEIPSKQRSPKVNMMLAKLLQHDCYNKRALTPLKLVLKECPLNLEAMKGLVALGVKPSEILAIIGESE